MSSKWAVALLIAGVALAQTPESFTKTCAPCHGSDASGTDRGPALARSRRLGARSTAEIRDIIARGTAKGMPAFPELQELAEWVRSLNVTAFDAPPKGDVAAGERYFFGGGRCSTCHTAKGRGRSIGPDLSAAGKQFTVEELERKFRDPAARSTANYTPVTVTLRDGSSLRGYARQESLHSLTLQTTDGRLIPLAEGEYTGVSREKSSNTHVAGEQPDLIAFLSRLGGIVPGAIEGRLEEVDAASIDQVLHPRRGEWPTYNGEVSGNRYSTLDQIKVANVAQLAPQWSYTIPYFGLEATPLVADGVMYVSGPNQVHALGCASRASRSGRTSRPRTTSRNVAGDAAQGANRGVALLGDRVFFATDDAHLICLDRLTGALLWDVYMPESRSTTARPSAPLVAGDLVIAGVAGADEGIRGFVAAYKADTGKLAWRFWTVPRPGEPGSETWQGSAIEWAAAPPG